MKRLLNLVILFLIFSTSVLAQGKAKYVFYFIGDGMGADQVNGTEMFLAEKEGRIGISPLLFTFAISALLLIEASTYCLKSSKIASK